MIEKDAREPIRKPNPENNLGTGSTEPTGPGPGISRSGPSETGQAHRGTIRDTKYAFKHGSPDDVKEEVRTMVEKGVAAFAGAVRGFVDTMKKEDVKTRAQEAVRETGDTTRGVARTVAEEGRKVVDEGRRTKDRLKSSGSETGTGTTTGTGGTTRPGSPPGGSGLNP